MIGIENGGDKDGKDKQGSKLSAEIVRIFAIIIAVVKTPKESGGNGNFDMFPGGFVDGSEKANGAVLAGEVVKKMSKSASGGDNNDAEPHDEGVVHGYIIA